MPTHEVEYSTTETKFIGRSGLVTWTDAHAAILEYGREMLARYEQTFSTLACAGSYRAVRKARKVVGLNIAMALAQLRANLYTQKRPVRGLRRIKSRNWKNPSAYISDRNRRYAWRNPVGRTPLSEAQWKYRYGLRLVKRRKYKHKGDRPKIKVPKTSNARPKKSDPAWIKGARYLFKKPGRKPLSASEWLKRYKARLANKRKGTQRPAVKIPAVKTFRRAIQRDDIPEETRHATPFPSRSTPPADAGETLEYARELGEHLVDYAKDKAVGYVNQKTKELTDQFTAWVRDKARTLIDDGRGD